VDHKGAAAMMAIMQVAYPRFYAQQGEVQMKAAVSLWADALADYPEEAIHVALVRVIRESPFPPTIADIVKRLEVMRDTGSDAPEALWRKVVRAVCDGYYHAAERFEELPSVCKQFVGSPENLRSMSQMDEDVLMTVTRGQFMKRVDTLLECEKVMQETPAHVLRLMQGLGGAMRMPEADGRLLGEV